jgi:hypothetical protein
MPRTSKPQSSATWSLDDVAAWFTGRVPDGWFTAALDVTVDRDEILVVGTLAEPKVEGSSDDARQVACLARIDGFREDTRAQRMRVAGDAERIWGRKVSWGASCGEVRQDFTTHAAPVMTRLRMSERSVLDTLIDAGVARTRSESVAWCVRLVGKHQSDWIGQLREAMEHVERVRADGPDTSPDAPEGEADTDPDEATDS